MDNKKKFDKLDGLPSHDRFALTETKLKGRVLFVEKVVKAKEYLTKLTENPNPIF